MLKQTFVNIVNENQYFCVVRPCPKRFIFPPKACFSLLPISSAICFLP